MGFRSGGGGGFNIYTPLFYPFAFLLFYFFTALSSFLAQWFTPSSLVNLCS
jgi:hypothetical protein